MDQVNNTIDSKSDLERLIALRRLAIDYRDGRFTAEWKENLRFYLGDQYNKEDIEKLANWRAVSTNNVIFPTVEQVHSLLTDDQTIAFVRRVSNGSYQVERLLDNIVKHIWDAQKILAKQSLWEKDRLTYGIGYFKVDYDKKADTLLHITVDRKSPFDIYPDPLAKCIDECEYIFERERISKSKLIDKYPEFYEEIIDQSGDAGNPIGEESQPDEISGNFMMSDAVYIWHCYFKDLSMLELADDSKELTEKSLKKRIRKYPYGRCVVLYGDIVLEDYALKCGFPYIATPLMSVPDEFFGQSLITPMKDAQEELNANKSMVIDNLKSNVNPIWVATEGVIDVDSIVPMPNTVILLRDKQRDMFEKLPGIQLPAEVFQMIQSTRQEIMASAGVNDATFGMGAQSARPGTVKSNFNASITRIREFLRGSHRAVEDIGRKIIKLLQVYVPVNTQVSLANRDDAILDFSDSSIIEDVLKGIENPAITKNLNVVKVILNEPNPDFKAQLTQLIQAGQADIAIPEEELKQIVLSKGILEFKNDIREGSYDYLVSSHPFTVQDPDQLMELLTILLQYGSADPATGSPGIIDFKFVLDNLNLPNKADLVRRLTKKQKMMEAQLQAQQNQPQPQGA